MSYFRYIITFCLCVAIVTIQWAHANESILISKLRAFKGLGSDERNHYRQRYLAAFKDKGSPWPAYPFNDSANGKLLFQMGNVLRQKSRYNRVYLLGRSCTWLGVSYLLSQMNRGMGPGKACASLETVAFSGKWHLLNSQLPRDQVGFYKDDRYPLGARITAYRNYLELIGLDPHSIIKRMQSSRKKAAQRPRTVLVDYAHSGGSLYSFFELLTDWAKEENLLSEVQRSIQLFLIYSPSSRLLTAPYSPFGIAQVKHDLNRHHRFRKLVSQMAEADPYDDKSGLVPSYPFYDWTEFRPSSIHRTEMGDRAELVLFRLFELAEEEGLLPGI